MALTAASAATRVFPEPTSPWTRRIIGCVFSKSASISLTTRAWALVGEKGNWASSCFFSESHDAKGNATSCCPLLRTANIERFCASNSSMIKRIWAGCLPSSNSSKLMVGGGRWIVCNACDMVIWWLYKPEGSNSCTAALSRSDKACSVRLRKVIWRNPSVVG